MKNEQNENMQVQENLLKRILKHCWNWNIKNAKFQS